MNLSDKNKKVADKQQRLNECKRIAILKPNSRQVTVLVRTLHGIYTYCKSTNNSSFDCVHISMIVFVATFGGRFSEEISSKAGSAHHNMV